MEENEIFEEVVVEDIIEDVNNTELDTPVQEVEEDNSLDQDEFIHALLRLMEEEKSLHEEEEAPLFNDGIVDVVPDIEINTSPDYTELLESINYKLDDIYNLIQEESKPIPIDTPISEYDLTHFLLIVSLGVLLLSCFYRIIKDNLLKL